MKLKLEGFAPLLLILLIAVVAIGAGVLYTTKKAPPAANSPQQPVGASYGTAAQAPSAQSPYPPQTNTTSSSGKPCSPPGTPTCDLNGHTISNRGAARLQSAPAGLSHTLPRQYSYTNPQANTASGSGQPCSPPGTPTCDPSGHTISAMQSATGGSSGLSQNVPSLSDSVVGSVQLTGHAPQGLDVDPATGYVYTGNNGNIVAKCAGSNPNSTERNVTFTPTLQKGDNTMSIVDPSRMKELSLIPTDFSPIWPTVDSAKGVVYMAASPDVDVFKLTTGAKITSYNVGGSPHQVAIDNATGILVASNTYDGSENYYSAVDTNTGEIIGHYPGLGMPHGVVLDAARDLAYMVAVKDGTIGVIDMASGNLKKTYATDNGSTSFRGTNIITFSPRERRIFFVESDQTSGFQGVEVLNADTGALVGKISLPTIPWGIAVDDAHHLLYAALPDLDSIGIASTDTFKEVASIPVSACPFAVKIDSTRELGFSTGMVHSQMSVFNLSKVMADLKKLNIPGI